MCKEEGNAKSFQYDLLPNSTSSIDKQNTITPHPSSSQYHQLNAHWTLSKSVTNYTNESKWFSKQKAAERTMKGGDW